MLYPRSLEIYKMLKNLNIMHNLQKYNNIFNQIFNIQVENISHTIDIDSIATWNSITQLSLIASLEDEFDIMFETEDILDFKSYDIGKEILKKYNIEVSA